MLSTQPTHRRHKQARQILKVRTFTNNSASFYRSSKVKYTVDLYSASLLEPLMRSRDHLSYGITQCYLPPGRGDSPDFTLAFTSTHFTILWKVEGSVDLGTAVMVHNPCLRLYIAVVVVINTKPWWASMLGPNTPQSSILPRDHCDLNPIHQMCYQSNCQKDYRLPSCFLPYSRYMMYKCTVCQHRDPLSPEEGQQCALIQQCFTLGHATE